MKTFTEKQLVLTLVLGVSAILTSYVTADEGEAFLVAPDKLGRMLRENFSTKRNHLEPDEKDQARTYIRNFFKDLEDKKIGGVLEEQSGDYLVGDATTSPRRATVINYIYTIRGNKWGTSEDRPILLGSHYDTEVNTPGVDDNGSGMVGLLSAAEYITDYLKENDYTLNYTLILVAFDFEEIGDVNATDADVKKSLLGSNMFVNDYLGPQVLDKFNLTEEDFQGAVVLETMMNWNSTNNTQLFPVGIDTLFPVQYQEMSSRGFKGDFITINARVNDAPLGVAFTRLWSSSVMSDKYRSLLLTLPIANRPPDLSPAFWNLAKNSFRSDHYRFWEYGKTGGRGLKGLMVSDTGDFRGTMQECYHNICDDVDSITDEKLEFLAKITHTVIRMMLEATEPGKQPEPSRSSIYSFQTPLILAAAAAASLVKHLV